MKNRAKMDTAQTL